MSRHRLFVGKWCLSVNRLRAWITHRMKALVDMKKKKKTEIFLGFSSLLMRKRGFLEVFKQKGLFFSQVFLQLCNILFFLKKLTSILIEKQCNNKPHTYNQWEYTNFTVYHGNHRFGQRNSGPLTFYRWLQTSMMIATPKKYVTQYNPYFFPFPEIVTSGFLSSLNGRFCLKNAVNL